MYEDGLVHSVVTNAFEENPAPEEGNLERMDIDICAIVVPRIRADSVRYESSKKTVEVEQKEQRQNTRHDQIKKKEPVERGVRRCQE